MARRTLSWMSHELEERRSKYIVMLWKGISQTYFCAIQCGLRPSRVQVHCSSFTVTKPRDSVTNLFSESNVTTKVKKYFVLYTVIRNVNEYVNKSCLIRNWVFHHKMIVNFSREEMSSRPIVSLKISYYSLLHRHREDYGVACQSDYYLNYSHADTHYKWTS